MARPHFCRCADSHFRCGLRESAARRKSVKIGTIRFAGPPSVIYSPSGNPYLPPHAGRATPRAARLTHRDHSRPRMHTDRTPIERRAAESSSPGSTAPRRTRPPPSPSTRSSPPTRPSSSTWRSPSSWSASSAANCSTWRSTAPGSRTTTRRSGGCSPSSRSASAPAGRTGPFPAASPSERSTFRFTRSSTPNANRAPGASADGRHARDPRHRRLGSRRASGRAAPAWPEAGGKVGDFNLLRQLGKGAFGRVFLATRRADHPARRRQDLQAEVRRGQGARPAWAPERRVRPVRPA